MKKLFYLLLLAIFVSCSNKEVNNSIQDQEDKSSAETITFTEEQIKLANIKTGRLTSRTISESIECTGTIEVPPGNIASVSPIIDGFIKSLNYFPGESVKKGDVLATLQHPGFIQLQKEYLEAKSQTEYFEQEYKRQGELTVENAASIKKMQKAKADYFTAEANYKSLKAQLELLGIDPKKIETNDFEKSFKLISPIDGKVSQLSANTGKFVSPEDIIYEIINDGNLFIQLNVFEKDISKAGIGQSIKFNLINDTSQYTAQVKRIGIGVDKINRTIIVHGLTEKKNPNLKPGKFINATICINERKAYSVPSSSVIEFNNEYYVFVKDGLHFYLNKISKGIDQDGFTEILDPGNKLNNSDIVVNGTYYLLSKLESEN